MLSGNAIRHARLPAAPGRRSDRRGALERWLAGREPRRYGLPADAIVLVRGVRARWAEVAGDGDTGDGHARGGDALAAALAGARRPAHEGSAAGAASAVWFNDGAELLACLARDALAGPLHAHWWWPTLLRDGTDTAAAIAYWIRSARAVPRAVERLRALQPEATWFAAWDGWSRGRLVAALAQHWPLATAVVEAVERPVSATRSRPPPASAAMASTAALDRDEAKAADEERGRAASSPALRLERLCLALARDPTAAADLASFRRAIESDDVGAGPARAVAPGGFVSKPADRRASPARRREVPATLVGGSAAATRDASTAATAPGIATFAVVADERPARAGSVDVVAGSDAVPGAATRSANRVEAKAAATASSASPTDDRPAAATVFDSAHAGLFFVVNAALHLGLYGDFSQPQHDGLAISPYRFLHDVGRAIGKRRFRRDPLAAWLDAEAGPDRDGDAAGPQRSTPTFVVAYLRARLALALGLTDPRRLAAALLRVSGRIRIGGDRIDVFFALRDLPLDIRLAGLDRDPGWLPAAGRDLRFHFD